VTYPISIDISGSFALDATPIFPTPDQILSLPRVWSIPITLEPIAEYFITIWRFRLPGHIQLIGLITDICAENLHLRGEISLSKGIVWTETIYICHFINPLLHRLLCLPETDQLLPSSLVAEALRLGATIYLAAIRYAFGITPFQSGAHVRKIKALLDRCENTRIDQGDQNLWRDLGWGWIKIWTLGCAVINKPSGIDGQWLLNQFHIEMGNLGMETYDDFEKYVGPFFWIPEVQYMARC